MFCGMNNCRGYKQMIQASYTETSSVLYGLYLDILTGIFFGDYPPKSTLPTEDRLAADYGVSRTVVRAALAMLKKKGILQSHQGSGTVVACSNPKTLMLPDLKELLPELQNCYACRLAIEPEIAAQLASHPTESATTFLVKQLKELQRSGNNDPQADILATANDADFHVRLAAFSGNSFFSSIMVAMRPHMLFSMNIKKFMNQVAQSNHHELSRREHRNIVGAILDRDANAARRYMREHIANGCERVFPKDMRCPDARHAL